MSLATLLFELRPLLEKPSENIDEISALLERHKDLAEYEVARFYAARFLSGESERLVDSLDPRDRLRAIHLVRAVGLRSQASRVLRRVAKDGNLFVRYRARSTIKKLGLQEVALPDGRYRERKDRYFGRYNISGWAFGILTPPTTLSAESRKYRGLHARRASRATVLAGRGIPALADTAALCTLLGVEKVADLRRFFRPGAGKGSGYIEFAIKKRDGSARRLAAPRQALKVIQRAIDRKILRPLPVHDACHGFVRGRSTVTNATPHKGASLVVKVDVKDFFPSIHYRRVLGLFVHYGYGTDVAAMLARLVTHRSTLEDGLVVWPGALPQGAPTSPALANLVCRRLDRRLERLAEKCGAVYTRYADDLTFSFANKPEVRVGRFLWWVGSILQQEGFNENVKKRRVLRGKSQQRVTGIVVNDGVKIPREDRRRFRAILHNCKRDGIDAQRRGKDHFIAYLRGYAAYVSMVQPDLGARFVREVEALVRGASGVSGEE